MKTSRGWPSLVLLALCIAGASPATAQYMYLDLNGDGLHSSLDSLSGALPVNVDVYLRTDQNRDGTHPTCATGQSLSIGSFEFILRAVGGTVTWGSLTGGLFAGAPLRTAHDAVDFYAGRFDTTTTYVPAGKVLLGSITVTPLTGTPLLAFETSTPLSARYLTSFGSQCAGPDGEYTMELGRDWFDADGTAGALLSNVSGTVFKDSNGTSGGNCVPDAGEAGMPGWLVTLSPGGMQALTTQTGTYQFQNVLPGLYTVDVTVPSPWTQTCPTGGAGQPVAVLLGQTYPGLNFGVKPSNLPPLLSPLTNAVIPYGHVTNVSLSGSDPDATPLTFSLLNGPGFASVSTLGPTTGNLALTPSPSDVGTYAVTVAASDGVYDSRRSAMIRVLNATAVPERGTPAAPEVVIRPNPVNPAGSLTLRTSRPGFARIALYDVHGRLVRVLVDKPLIPAGTHEYPLDARDGRGAPLPSGVYLIKVDTVDGSRSERVAIVK